MSDAHKHAMNIRNEIIRQNDERRAREEAEKAAEEQWKPPVHRYNPHPDELTAPRSLIKPNTIQDIVAGKGTGRSFEERIADIIRPVEEDHAKSNSSDPAKNNGRCGL